MHQSKKYNGKSNGMNIIKRILRIIARRGTDSHAFVESLRQKGVAVGEGTYFFDPQSTRIDCQRPHMLSIGSNVKVTAGVIVLCHDYSRSVLIDAFGENVGEAAVTSIGDNVFIGMNAIVLMGSRIGDDCVIGAGSVVSGSIPPRSVAAGNPAKVICSIDDFYRKRKERELASAELFAKEFARANGRPPTAIEMTDAFSWLYLPHTEETIEKYPELFGLHGVNRDEAVSAFLNSSPKFENYDGWLKSTGLSH